MPKRTRKRHVQGQIAERFKKGAVTIIHRINSMPEISASEIGSSIRDATGEELAGNVEVLSQEKAGKIPHIGVGPHTPVIVQATNLPILSEDQLESLTAGIKDVINVTYINYMIGTGT